jgi:hypothetical protein
MLSMTWLPEFYINIQCSDLNFTWHGELRKVILQVSFVCVRMCLKG